MKKKNLLTKSFLILVIISMLSLFTSCEIEEGIIAGAIIGGVIGGVIADDSNNHHHHPGHYRRCTSWHDRRGRKHRRCRSFETYRSNNLFPTVNVNTTEQNSATFAENRNISYEAAAKINSLVLKVKNGNIAALYDFGFEEGDLKSIINQDSISEDSIDRISQTLNLDINDTEELISDLLEESKLQLTDINSSYWQTCMDKGSWKTNGNFYCKSVNWQNCSPKTGAKYCY